jgi:hypothetical protein
MPFRKDVLSSIPKCYAAMGFVEQGQPKLIFAGEGQGALHVFSGDGFAVRDTVWEGGGGTMSIAALRGNDRAFLASRGFYSMVEARESTIEIVRRAQGGYAHEPVARLPYLHRFGVIASADERAWVVAATIAQSKESKEDWSRPGHLYVAQLPEDADRPFTLKWTRLPGEYTKNHGFCTARHGAGECAYLCCEEGVYRVLPPGAGGADWSVHQILSIPASDIAAMDIDDDGEDELAIIQPFHGNRFSIYRRQGDEYREIYAYPVRQDFYHAVCAARLGGEKLFIGGARRGAMQLFAIGWRNGRLDSFVIDENVGPSNVAVLNLEDRDILLSANRQIDEAAIYSWAT